MNQVNKTPLVSIVVVNWEGQEYLEKCFTSLYANDFQDFEIIFFDNGSMDGSVPYIKENFPKIICLSSPVNLGLAKACNQAFEKVRGQYVFFLNNDIIADQRLLSELVHAAQKDSSLGILGCKTVSYHGLNVLNEGVSMDIFGYSYGEGVPFYVDAAIFMPSHVFKELGKFDDRFLIYKEDVDLCWRAWLYGYKVKVIPQAWFHHDSYCASQNKTYTTTFQRRCLSEAHTLCMILKNYSFLTLICVFPLYFALNFLELIVFGVLRWQWKQPLLIQLDAIHWNLKHIRQTLKSRRLIQNKRIRSDWFIFKHLKKTSGKVTLFKNLGLPQISNT